MSLFPILSTVNKTKTLLANSNENIEKSCLFAPDFSANASGANVSFKRTLIKKTSNGDFLSSQIKGFSPSITQYTETTQESTAEKSFLPNQSHQTSSSLIESFRPNLESTRREEEELKLSTVDGCSEDFDFGNPVLESTRKSGCDEMSGTLKTNSQIEICQKPEYIGPIHSTLTTIKLTTTTAETKSNTTPDTETTTHGKLTTSETITDTAAKLTKTESNEISLSNNTHQTTAENTLITPLYQETDWFLLSRKRRSLHECKDDCDELVCPLLPTMSQFSMFINLHSEKPSLNIESVKKQEYVNAFLNQINISNSNEEISMQMLDEIAGINDNFNFDTSSVQNKSGMMGIVDEVLERTDFNNNVEYISNLVKSCRIHDEESEDRGVSLRACLKELSDCLVKVIQETKDGRIFRKINDEFLRKFWGWLACRVELPLDEIAETLEKLQNDIYQ